MNKITYKTVKETQLTKRHITAYLNGEYIAYIIKDNQAQLPGWYIVIAVPPKDNLPSKGPLKTLKEAKERLELIYRV